MKKHIALLLSVGMIFASFAQVNAQADDMIFIDPADENYLTNLVNLGIFSLYTDESFFDGTKEVTRAEAAMSLAGLLNMAKGTDASVGEKFVDVLPTEPASGSIALMNGLGAMGGFGDNLFRPYDTIQEIHFIKALMVTLGYNWRAELAGGYPNGYINAAVDAGVLEDLSVSDGAVLTRSKLLKLLNKAIAVPVYDVVSLEDGQAKLEYNKDINVLTKYHHIYQDEAIVNSNSITSLNEAFTPQEQSVLIGDRTVYLGADKSIWTHLGENITYYYKQPDSGSKAVLVWFEPADNNIVTLNDTELESVSGSDVTYIDAASGKEKRVSYNSSSLVVYNGGRGGVTLSDKLVDFSGTVSFINNDGDGDTDVVILNDYTYDEVYSVDADRKQIFFKSQTVELDLAEGYSIENQSGEVMEFAEVIVGDVYGIAKSSDGSLVRLVNLTSAISGNVSEKGTDSLVVDGTAYKLSGAVLTQGISEIELGGAYTLCLNSSGMVVYIKEGKSDALSIGYLIDYTVKNSAFDTTVYLKIMTAGGSKEVLELKDDVDINNVSFEKEAVPAKLAELKSNLNLASDGEVSQVVRYQTDAEGYISTIYTALLEENDYLQLKFNSEGTNAHLRDHGYGVGAFKYKYLIGNKTTFFQVPQTEQESLSEDYYLTFRYQDKMDDGDSYMVETYTIADEVYPSAAVYYTKSTAEIDPYANLFLVDKVSQSMNSLGDPVTKFTGNMLGKSVTYESIDPLDISGVEKGDALVFDLTPLDEVKDFIKVYDVSENTIAEKYFNEDISQQISVSMFSVYKSKDVYMEATNKGFDDMDAALDNMYGLNFSRVSTIAVYDSENDKTSITTPASIVDYIHAGDNCTKMLIRYQFGYMQDIIIYK